MATSITLTMLGCFKERRSEISLIAVMGVPSRLSEESILMVLSATISPERRSLARLRHGVRAHTSEVEFTRLLRTLKQSVGENEWESTSFTYLVEFFEFMDRCCGTVEAC